MAFKDFAARAVCLAYRWNTGTRRPAEFLGAVQARHHVVSFQQRRRVSTRRRDPAGRGLLLSLHQSLSLDEALGFAEGLFTGKPTRGFKVRLALQYSVGLPGRNRVEQAE